MTTAIVRSWLLIFVLLAALLTPGCDDGDKDAIKEAWETYCKARINCDADKMLTLIDPENIKYYDNIVRLARSGKRDQLMRVSNWELLQITVLRGTMTADDLKGMDGTKLFKKAFGREGVQIDDTTPLLDLANLKLQRPRATANLAVDGIELNIPVEFVQVNDTWVINNDCLNDWMNERIKRVAKFWNITEEGVILRSASNRVGKEMHRSTWDEPPK